MAGNFRSGGLEQLFHVFSQVGLAEEVEEAEVHMLGPDALEDPTSLIVEAKGSIKNCIFILPLTCIDDTSESESETDTESIESSKSSASPDDIGIDFDGDIHKEIRALIEREDERHA
ncbi:hypothetical protein RHMOL_Rhmol11G0010400 [Rhododendron molle]|uniref:Uncharacterized protein n=1 Tax=Rhododendron molle TaxID=49168 RepID=A0ACC0LNQ6_RHOML|nr:hypothetical protein RHMOL_Rhmol11G0010400 [Rhododendron molle]